MTVTDELLAANAAYAAEFTGGLPGAPSRRLAVVACMDARLDVYRVLGLAPGEANVIRNAGGVVTDDTIRSLAVSQHRLGTDEIVLVHHTGCGMQTFTDEDFARELRETSGATPTWTAGAFTDLEADVRASIARILASPFVPNKRSVRGFVFDVETGELREVD